MFYKYEPEESDLIICSQCGVALERSIVTRHPRDHVKDEIITITECPVCKQEYID